MRFFILIATLFALLALTTAGAARRGGPQGGQQFGQTGAPPVGQHFGQPPQGGAPQGGFLPQQVGLVGQPILPPNGTLASNSTITATEAGTTEASATEASTTEASTTHVSSA